MRNRLPILMLVLLLAAVAWWGRSFLQQWMSHEGSLAPQQGAVTERLDAEDAARLVQSAIVALEGQHSVSARVQITTTLYGRTLRGSGIYRQGPWNRRWVRMELNLGRPEQPHVLEQVCDGEHLWIRRSVHKKQSVEHALVAPLLAQSASIGESQGPQAFRAIGLGGLPRLLRGLESSLDFTTAEAAVVHGLKVWVIRGQWRTEALAAMAPDQAESLQAGNPVDWKNASPRLTDQVVLFLDREELFPYRIEWLRSTRTQRRRWHHALRAPQDDCQLALEFDRVDLNAQVAAEDFTFDPGALPVTDITTDLAAALTAP